MLTSRNIYWVFTRSTGISPNLLGFHNMSTDISQVLLTKILQLIFNIGYLTFDINMPWHLTSDTGTNDTVPFSLMDSEVILAIWKVQVIHSVTEYVQYVYIVELYWIYLYWNILPTKYSTWRISYLTDICTNRTWQCVITIIWTYDRHIKSWSGSNEKTKGVSVKCALERFEDNWIFTDNSAKPQKWVYKPPQNPQFLHINAGVPFC